MLSQGKKRISEIGRKTLNKFHKNYEIMLFKRLKKMER